MNLEELTQYLLAMRGRFSDSTILDCLALAKLVPDLQPWQRVSAQTVCELFGVTNPSYASKRLTRLVLAGLLEYEAGVSGEPGYLFLRVGPK